MSRPRSRGECADGERPCPWVGCRFHLALDVSETGSLYGVMRANGHRDVLRRKGPRPTDVTVDAFGDALVDQLERMAETCALDIAERGGSTLDEVGQVMGCTRERVRQLESGALVKLRVAGDHAMTEGKEPVSHQSPNWFKWLM